MTKHKTLQQSSTCLTYRRPWVQHLAQQQHHHYNKKTVKKRSEFQRFSFFRLQLLSFFFSQFLTKSRNGHHSPQSLSRLCCVMTVEPLKATTQGQRSPKKRMIPYLQVSFISGDSVEAPLHIYYSLRTHLGKNIFVTPQLKMIS